MKNSVKLSFTAVFLSGFLLSAPVSKLQATSMLDIGTDYRLQAISLSKTDYGATSGQNYSFLSERALAYIGGSFSPNIEMMVQFQALGIVGASSSTLSSPSVNPAAGRYPNTNFSPWVQWAYVKASHIYDTPISLTAGRQPMILGDGLIVSDDGLGFTGVRAQSQLPWWDLSGDVFAFKTGDELQNPAGSILGVDLTKQYDQIRYQVAVVNEQDNSGSTLYIRPSENAATSNPVYQNFFPANSTVPPLESQFNFAASEINKTYYDGRLEGRFLEGGFYKAEAAIQSGYVDRDPSLATSSAAALGYSPYVKLSGYAFQVSGGLYTRFSKYGPIEIHGTFGQASGDSGGSTDSSFQPLYGHQFDGLERSGFGEMYGATLYNALPSASYSQGSSTPSVSGLPAGYSGIRVIGAGVTTHPTPLISIGIDYYVYFAMETPGSNFALSSTDSTLGTELDVGAGFAYTSYLSFRLSYALFQPGAAYPSTSNAQRILLEATGRF